MWYSPKEPLAKRQVTRSLKKPLSSSGTNANITAPKDVLMMVVRPIREKS